jgi:hypothetical protein
MIGRIISVFGMLFPMVILSVAADLQVDSESLGPIVLGKKIKLIMRDSSYIEGKVLRAGHDEILIRINKSEPRGSSPGMEKSKDSYVRTADIGTVCFYKSGSIAGPVAFGVIGGFLGAVGSAYAFKDSRGTAGPLTAFIASTAGGATGGALLGKEAVKKTITIVVVPSIR